MPAWTATTKSTVSLVLWGGLYGFALTAAADQVPPAPAVQPLPPQLETGAEAPRMPQAGHGAWRAHVQLVWDVANGRLERRRYEIFDPFAEAGFDIFWEARRVQSDGPGCIAGQGVITWRRPGALRYGMETIVAQYRGATADGRPEGYGIFVDRSGLRYDGEWANGLMDGEGHLLLPNGDVYRGGFKAGRIHGRGIYIDAAGRVYDGGFSEGLRDGPAQVAEPNGFAYASVWIQGVEDQTQRQAAPEAWAQQYRVQMGGTAPAELAITVGVGGPAKFCCHSGGPPAFGYTSTSLADRLEIYPDAPRLLDVWRGRTNIVIPDATLFDWDRALAEEYSLLNYNSNYNKTVPLQFGMENRGTNPANIVGAYLDVARSQVDMQPALQSIELTPLSGQSIDFSIENYGWSPARNAHLTIRFQNAAKNLRTDPIQITIGEISGIQKFSFAPAMKQLGVRTERLPSLRQACLDKEDACLAKLIKSGVFGRLAEFVLVEDKKFGFRASGQLDYEWRDAQGRSQTTTAPFDAFVPIGSFQSLAECEGGDSKDIAGGQPFLLAENRERYRIPFPLQAKVDAGTISRWRIVLDATKSSQHDMRIVLQLANGQEVVSRNISLLLFNPKKYPQSVRPFEPRC